MFVGISLESDDSDEKRRRNLVPTHNFEKVIQYRSQITSRALAIKSRVTRMKLVPAREYIASVEHCEYSSAQVLAINLLVNPLLL